ncbi:MAG TPA: hypothetical protein PK156_16325, partial [Polyangium sp.]|nr:hypothetical protein [Polyangium sp.]
ELHYEIQNLLAAGCDDDLLLGGSSRVWQVVKLHSSDRSEFVINLGAKNLKRNQKRTKSFPHFERPDGAWFDFALIARADLNQPIEIISYSFELRLDDVKWQSRPAHERVPAYVRFDLNPHDHPNATLGHRCHVHIGSEAFSMPSAWLSPLEILDLFIRGFVPSGRG